MTNSEFPIIEMSTVKTLLAILVQMTIVSNASSQSLSCVFEDDFPVGIAVDETRLNDALYVQLIRNHFTSLTTQDSLKWLPIHPEENAYRFARTDRTLEFAETNGLDVLGHTLVWHNSLPEWVLGDKPDKRTLLARMESHIATLLDRYRGRFVGMDVVNEAILVDGSLRDSGFQLSIGDDYIKHAFRFAEAADPDLPLIYNDFQIVSAPKRRRIIQLIEELRAAGVRIDAVAFQAHWRLDSPSIDTIENAIVDIAAADVKVIISELDIDVLPDGWPRRGEHIADMTAEDQAKFDPYAPSRGGIPREVLQRQADRYVELFQLFRKHRDKIDRVTLWGLSDEDSWLNNYPIKGRTNYPLLFDRDDRGKPALQALLSMSGSTTADIGPDERPCQRQGPQ